MENVTFVHIPKTAGTSITKALGCSGGHKRLSRRLEYWDIAHHFKFAFVRHPISRFISAYFNMAKDPPIEINEFVRVYPKHFMWDQILFKPQWWFICDDDGNILVDFVGRYERLALDWEIVCNKIGLKYEGLPIENKTICNPVSLEPETVKALGEIYAKDFELFGYERS